MDLFNSFAILIALATAFSFLNYRYLRLPATIGVMLIALISSLAVVCIGAFVPSFFQEARMAVDDVDFSNILLEVMLSFLLFAGAFHIDTKSLIAERGIVLAYATLGVIISTFVVGVLMYFILDALGLGMSLIYCLLFGALISPTDPIAVLAILKEAKVPKSIEIDIAGESLLNDGVAVVVFLSIFEISEMGFEEVGTQEIFMLFLEEAGGGALFGLALGYVGYWFLKQIEEDVVDIMLTLTLVMGGYALANLLHVSGPLAIVVAGLVISGLRTRTEVARDIVDHFWEMIDEILNAILFLLIGLVLLTVEFNKMYLIAGLIATFVVLLARLISILLPLPLTKLRCGKSITETVVLLTWGGLRGGISVALSLTLTQEMPRDLIVTLTYIVVVFSIIVQGLTVGKLVKRLNLKAL